MHAQFGTCRSDVWRASWRGFEVPTLYGRAQRETTIGNGKDTLAVSEVRRLTETGRQTSIISKADWLDEIIRLDAALERAKGTLKGVAKHIAWGELSEAERFKQLPQSRRALMNTIGMISYRAETALAAALGQPTASLSAARALLQDLFTTPADLCPDPVRKELHVRLHGAGKPQ
ncbi:MAG: hypothetical protein GXY61_13015 [Lentisphaerae bacterium]|jgi:hypothetical protein|nr:hypothetical protein [Lentisphaerota bacterium]